MSIAYLGFGSNLGDRAGRIEAALTRLANTGVRIVARSRLHETDAVTAEPEPCYLNAAARVETAFSARALLELCLGIERALGRIRPPGGEQAPRPIDIDLLLYADVRIDEPPRLVVPHPRLLTRAFVRIPLAEVATPGLTHPATGEPLDRAPADPSVRVL